MKRILLLLLVGGVFLINTSAQSVEIGAFYGYNFNTKIRTYYGDYKLYDAPNYGGQLSVGVAPGTFVELTYNRTDTRVNYYYLNAYEPLDMSTEYFMIGGLQEVTINSENVVPYGTFSLGATRFDLKESYGNLYAGDEWKFSIALAGGAKILLGERLGIRLQARMGLPLDFSGLWIGTGGGGASFRVPVVQFDFTAGLFLRLG